jgi:cyanophycin synthetase
VILKPLNLNHGRGISDRIDAPDELRRAWAASSEHAGRLIVETFATGRDHRVLVVGGRVVACAERVPAHVVGDGARTVRALVEEANRDPRRGRGHAKVLTYLPCDGPTEEYLARRGLTLDAVPAAGEAVFLRATANLSTGGTSIDRTDEVHPDNVTACEMAAGVIGPRRGRHRRAHARHLGAVPRERRGDHRGERGPGIRMHTHPARGARATWPAHRRHAATSRGSPRRSRSSPSPAPTARRPRRASSPTSSATPASTVGFTTTDGIYLGSRLVIEGDMTGRGRPT